MVVVLIFVGEFEAVAILFDSARYARVDGDSYPKSLRPRSVLACGVGLCDACLREEKGEFEHSHAKKVRYERIALPDKPKRNKAITHATQIEHIPDMHKTLETA